MTEQRAQPRLIAQVIFAATPFVLVVGLFVGLEVTLRVLDLGDADPSGPSRLKYQRVFLPLLEPATRPDGVEVLQTVDPRLPYQAIARDKPARSLRVFVFGGSATAGLGYSPNASFSRQLERMLRAAYPTREVELVNLGIVALASRQVKQIVADVSERYEPDLLVVYAGNNEFLEVHAQKYHAAHATWFSGTTDAVRDTNLFRLLAGLLVKPKAPSLAAHDLSHEDLRLTQEAIIRDIEMEPREVEDVIDRYESNISELTSSAREHDVPLLLLSVASNWEWRGRSDLPPDWLAEFLAIESTPTRAHWARALPALDAALRGNGTSQHELLYKRALVHEQLEDWSAARDDYRAAMNRDPHLRRALDAMNDRVRQVAKRQRVPFVDTVAMLEGEAEHGIVGFDELYDYVHLTPRGNVLVAAEIFRAIEREGLSPSQSSGFDPDAYVRAELEELARLSEDYLEADRWLGFSFDSGRLASRDLWKYDEMLSELDALIEREPQNVRARVYRGNASFFRVDGAEDAARDYRAALEAEAELPAVRTNLERLLEGRAL